MLQIPAAILPEVCSSSEVYGETKSEILGRAVPVAGIAGDQQAALFGQMCLEPGMVKNTYGTGCFILMNTGEKAASSRNKLLSTVAWRIGSQTVYALEGSVFIAGAVVQWLRDGLKIIRESAEVEELAASRIIFRPSRNPVGWSMMPRKSGNRNWRWLRRRLWSQK